MSIEVRKYTKKPVEIEAVQWDGRQISAYEVVEWINSLGGVAGHICLDHQNCTDHDGDFPHAIGIETLEGQMTAGENWWVIRGVEGEFYPCKDSVFRNNHVMPYEVEHVVHPDGSEEYTR